MKAKLIDTIRFILIAYSFSCVKLIAQPVPVEVMFGDKNYLYQHSFSKPFEETRFAFFHTSSLYAFYEEGKKAEIMSQSYITYTISPNLKFALGTFYASVPGFKPAAAIQIVKKSKDLFFLFVPRIDLWNNASVEGMMLVEYRPEITDRIKFYSKFQTMSNYGQGNHNRSYQNFRVGLDVRKTLFGIALNVDEFGSEIKTTRNCGVFLRHEFH